ncbi:cystatin C (amyloid angiopathy and cerebral hemorrhage) [Pseudoliparis swirei]|uniref:cystatin C (amyloid angiopathy and cerebral hemorrhage) n=1 Tax=Pseudoliparis swirei TaxID=2059687 RepID=UPI0024BEA4AE|nr:cystatin C (amyloid angiopathy and cerebral hemorrhage) [Pseudoliparis swirei]
MTWKIALLVLAVVFTVGSVGAMIGGFQDIDSNDEGVRNALSFSVVQHNRNSNDMFLSQVAEVIKAERQLVAGYKYRLTVRMAKTPCRKGGAGEVCEIHQDPANAQTYECMFTVWSRPWLNEIRMIEQTC